MHKIRRIIRRGRFSAIPKNQPRLARFANNPEAVEKLLHTSKVNLQIGFSDALATEMNCRCIKNIGSQSTSSGRDKDHSFRAAMIQRVDGERRSFESEASFQESSPFLVGRFPSFQ